EAVAQVALALAEQLVVDGEDEAVIARRPGALDELAGEAAVAVDEDLHPARRRLGRRQLLQGAHRAMAEAEAGARRRGRPRRGPLAVRPEQAAEPGRPDHHRQGEPAAE